MAVSALAISAPRATRFNPRTFDAFRVAEMPSGSRTYPLGMVAAGSLNEALNQVILHESLAHKDHLLIRETSESGETLHLFAIKRKSTPRWVHKDHVTRPVHDLYAARVCAVNGDVLTQSPTRGPEAANNGSGQI